MLVIADNPTVAAYRPHCAITSMSHGPDLGLFANLFRLDAKLKLKHAVILRHTQAIRDWFILGTYNSNGRI